MDPRQTAGNPLDTRVAELLGRLTLEEKISLLSGRDMWHTRAIERLGVPSIRMTDGPHGVTVSGDLGGPATCFPTAVAMAATWNLDLIERVGTALGRETRARGNHILLGPSVDLHRSPLNGRNYESYSEDPYLAGRLAAAYVRGVQSQGVGACIKHCTANNQQTDQSSTSSEVDERALRELYLRPWELAVREAPPWAIMTSYNLLNGEYTSANRHLLTDIIKNEWGYSGIVVSDWRGVHSAAAAPAGLDLEMPGPGTYLTSEGLGPLLISGELSETDIDDKARRLLRATLRACEPPPPGVDPEGALDTPEHRLLAREVASEAVVLLKNEGDLLPLDPAHVRRIAVIGPNACEARLGGGGSSSTTPFYAISPIEGLRARCGDSVTLDYSEGCGLRGALPAVPPSSLAPPAGESSGPGTDAGPAGGLRGAYYASGDLTGPPALERQDDQLDFSWGWSSPGGQVPKDGWSARWVGHLIVPSTGRYRLGLTCEDGGTRLFLDDQCLIDTWELNDDDNFEAGYAAVSETAEVELVAGQSRQLCIEYCKVGNRAALRLEWQE
ncbi:glycoside hydrolase family 3 N-terminal domain-containing protein, partial [Candidatus Latescibacterota bacterium]